MHQGLAIFRQYPNTITRLVLDALSSNVQFDKANPGIRPWVRGDAAALGPPEVHLLVACDIAFIAYGREFPIDLFPGLILEKPGKFGSSRDRTANLKGHLQKPIGLDAMQPHPSFVADVGIPRCVIE